MSLITEIDKCKSRTHRGLLQRRKCEQRQFPL